LIPAYQPLEPGRRGATGGGVSRAGAATAAGRAMAGGAGRTTKLPFRTQHTGLPKSGTARPAIRRPAALKRR
jgi:hypothetical protein